MPDEAFLQALHRHMFGADTKTVQRELREWRRERHIDALKETPLPDKRQWVRKEDT